MTRNGPFYVFIGHALNLIELFSMTCSSALTSVPLCFINIFCLEVYTTTCFQTLTDILELFEYKKFNKEATCFKSTAFQL